MSLLSISSLISSLAEVTLVGLVSFEKVFRTLMMIHSFLTGLTYFGASLIWLFSLADSTDPFGFFHILKIDYFL